MAVSPDAEIQHRRPVGTAALSMAALGHMHGAPAIDRDQRRGAGAVNVAAQEQRGIACRGQRVEQVFGIAAGRDRSEEHTSELQSLMRISYAVFCLQKKKDTQHRNRSTSI